MPGYLLDTNHLSAAIGPDVALRDRIDNCHRVGERFGTCVPVLCELEAGVCGLFRPDIPRRQLERLLKYVRIWPLERGLPSYYGALHLELKKKGRALSYVDILIAAMARMRNCTILTADKDFSAVPDVRTENWIASS
jgi:predicted nucleic acid-binding protein